MASTQAFCLSPPVATAFKADAYSLLRAALINKWKLKVIKLTGYNFFFNFINLGSFFAKRSLAQKTQPVKQLPFGEVGDC